MAPLLSERMAFHCEPITYSSRSPWSLYCQRRYHIPSLEHASPPSSHSQLLHYSAGWRSRGLGSLCPSLRLTDASGESARYNPLAEIHLGDHEVRDAQNVADILIDPSATGDATTGTGPPMRFSWTSSSTPSGLD